MKNKVAVITGASSGIGRATAKRFAEEGATVIAIGRNEVELSLLRDETREFEGTVKVHLADVLEHFQIDRVLSETIQHSGQIDVLVNAAGVIQSGDVETTTLDEFDRMMNINVRSVLNLIQKCIPHREQTRESLMFPA